MTETISPECLDTLLDELAEHGWSLQRSFIAPTLTAELAAECRKRAGSGALRPAGIGRGDAQQIRESIRGDLIEWVEADQAPCVAQYLALLETLRIELNQQLYLGLEDFEGHFALYPPGAFYKAHLDRFKSDDKRSISTVLYLNEHWQASDGGQLRLHLDAQTIDVQPTGGDLIVFRSADILHEVLAASRERLSLVGWFRRRGDGPL